MWTIGGTAILRHMMVAFHHGLGTR